MIDERNEEATEEHRLAARITGEVRHLLVSLRGGQQIETTFSL